MKRFAKIFDLPEYQVVVAKDFSDQEDDECEGQIIATTFIDGVKVEMKYGYRDIENRDRDFDDYDAVGAERFVQSMINAFNESKDESEA